MRSIFLTISVVLVVCLMSLTFASWCIAPLPIRQPYSAAPVVAGMQPAPGQEERERRNLVAQEDMSRWTFWAMIISTGGLFTSIGALLLVSWTLAATRAQLREAQEANKNSRRQLVAAHRPWVFFKTVELRSGITFEGDSIAFEYEIAVSNSGQSPALQVTIHSEIFAPLESAAQIEEMKEQIRRGENIPRFAMMLTPGREHSAHTKTSLPHDFLRSQGSGTAIAPVLAAVVSYRSTLGDEMHLTSESIVILRKGHGQIEPETGDIAEQDLWVIPNPYAPGTAD